MLHEDDTFGALAASLADVRRAEHAGRPVLAAALRRAVAEAGGPAGPFARFQSVLGALDLPESDRPAAVAPSG